VTRLALRGLAARKLRSTLTIIAVLLGVTMIAGTFVLTDTIQKAFDNLFTAQTRGADVIVSSKPEIETDFAQPKPLPQEIVDRVGGLDEVEKVEGQINDFAAVVGKDGKVVTTGGAPTIAATYMSPPFEPITVAEGRAPRGPDEIMLDADTAEEQDFKLGDRVVVATEQPKRPYELAGLASFGNQSSLGGATVVVFDLPTAQALFDKRGEVDFAFVAGRDGVTATELRRAVASVLPPTAQVRTAAQEADALSDDIGEALSFLTTGLLAFGFIAVLVGAFLIFNTFSITVAQRSRELALLRTLGATRRQVLTSVMLEALTIGIVGSLIGIVAGLGFASAINSLFKAVGVDLPTTDLVLATRTIIVCLLTGTLVTLAGAIVPAVRATRVAPVEALREAAAPTRTRLGRLAPYFAVLLILAGGGLVVGGLLAEGGDTSTKLLGAAGGAVILILGIALLSPRFVGPAARVISAPIERLTKLTGRLARENSTRNPGRTAVTSAALMIGLALVVFVTVFANGIRASVEDVIDRTFAGDIAILHDDGFSPIPATIEPAVRSVDGVASVSGFKDSETRIRGIGGNRFTHAIEPESIRSVYNFDWKDGSDAALAQLGDDGTILEEGVADAGDFGVGDRIQVTGPAGRAALTVRGIYRDDGLLEGYAMSRAAFDRIAEQRRVSIVLAKVDEGQQVDAVQERVTAALRAFPEARARSQEELKDEQGESVQQILALFYALLAMSVIISAFGIVNTLTLSIFERTRELGLLRAVGMTKRDVRRTVRYESVITAVFGALLGLGLGLFFAFVVVQALSSEGLVFSLPLGQIVGFLLFAMLVGVLAAILPAYRASRLDVLEAIAYE
jgi:putative ABC transport system permease protein